MKRNARKAFAAIITACLLSFNTAVYAAPAFTDVPASHWAYTAIAYVADQGYIVGDTTGAFKPNDYIDKFDTMKVLARAAGYKYTNAAETEKAFYTQAYDKHKGILANYANSFSKWRQTSDWEIAYLMEKGIVAAEDLKQFIIKDTAGQEKLRALSREEAAVFLVRLIGKDGEALQSSAAAATFRDDNEISPGSKPYVNYLRNKNVISGDTENKFKPNDGVTRAAFAVMLYNTLRLQTGGSANYSGQTDYQTGVSSVVNLSGAFDVYYPQLGAVQIVQNDGKKKIYKLSQGAIIYVDGYVKTPADLKQGMSAVCVVMNDTELMELKASSAAASAAVTTPLQPAATPQTNQPGAYGNYVEGTVNQIKTENGVKTIHVNVRMVNPKGEIVDHVNIYVVTSASQITKDGVTLAFEAIVAGDVVRVDYTGESAGKIAIEPRDRSFSGATLIERKFAETTQTPILVLQDAAGKKYDLVVTESTAVSRTGITNATWRDLRLGDSVTATAQYEKLLSISGTGSHSTVEGVVQEIHISKGSASILFYNNATNTAETYGVIMSMMDVYSLRVGAGVKLRLDSREVESIVTVEAAANDTVTGTIQSIIGGVITLRNVVGTTGGTQDVKLDPSTVVTNAANGSRVNPSTLSIGQKIYVVCAPGTDTAQTISVLEQ